MPTYSITPLNRLDLFGLFSEINNLDCQILANIQLIEQAVKLGNKALWCHGHVGEVRVDLLINVDAIIKLHFTPEELGTGTVNILDHALELFPQSGNTIGLISFQNGMKNIKPEFEKSYHSILGSLTENTLFIGMYNPTKGLIRDLMRVNDTVKGVETPAISSTRQFLVGIGETLCKVNPEMLWLHIMHSEAGGIGRRAIEGMTPEQQKMMQEHLLSFGLGSILPIAKSSALETINVWSEADHATKGITKFYLSDPNYRIHFVPCISKWSERSGCIADHSSMGTTYQNARNDGLSEFKEKYGFHNIQTR